MIATPATNIPHAAPIRGPIAKTRAKYIEAYEILTGQAFGWK